MPAIHLPRAALVLLLAVAPLPSAAGLLVGANLAIEVGTLPVVSFAGAAVSGASIGPLYATFASGTGLAGTIHTPSPISAAPPISGLNYTVGANDGGVFSGPAASLVAGSMAIDVNLCAEAFGGLCLLNLALPFGVAVTVTPPVVSGIGITMHGSPWTAGTTTLALTTPTANGQTASTRMGSNGLNAKGAGTLVLVSAVNVLTNVAGQLPSFATLTLQYLPEPGALAWVAPGVAALGIVAHRLRRRRADEE